MNKAGKFPGNVPDPGPREATDSQVPGRQRQSRGSITIWCVSPWCLSLRHVRELLQQSNSCSHSLTVLHFSTPSLSSATRLAISHLTYTVSLPPSFGSNRVRHSLQPETWTDTSLGRHSVWVATVFLSSALVSACSLAGFAVWEAASR